MVYLFIMLFSIVATPYLVKYATSIRGYKAYGGEYLIPILGWIIATVYYDICKGIKNRKNRREDYE